MFPIQPLNSLKPNSVWVECGGDAGFWANCFERDKSPSVLPRSSRREKNNEEGAEDEDTTAVLPVTPVSLCPVHSLTVVTAVGVFTLNTKQNHSGVS